MSNPELRDVSNELVLSQRSDGSQYVTSLAHSQRVGETVAARAPLRFPNTTTFDQFVLCQKPNGDEIVTTEEACETSGGTCIGVWRRPPGVTGGGAKDPSTPVLCRPPGGAPVDDFVTSYQNCTEIVHGTVVGKA